MIIIKTNKTKTSNRDSFPYFCFCYSPVLLPFLKSHDTLYPPQVTFSTIMLQHWNGLWQGRGGWEEASFFLYSLKWKQSKWCSLNLLQSSLTGHCQRIVPLHNDEHFSPSLCVFKKNMTVTAVNCEILSSWLVLIYKTEIKMWIGHRQENLRIIFRVLVLRQGKKIIIRQLACL